ncbi:MAG: acetyl-CoA carboxylase biotin carboxylase subunit [Alphaproteobacteria bacterium]|nr:MAG: acetyl-CoA carboxylase biotin carboxylase subunit [Alphaproteobacteria bacterium]
MFQKILIANRGEIALRIYRACHDLGIPAVAVHSTVDDDAMHVRLADESVCIGPAPAAESYLNIPAILSACEISQADAIHPGYGFLSENSKFAEIVEAHDITFIGPKPEHIQLMGNKIAAKAKMQELGIPVVPGSDEKINSEQDARRIAADVGYPVIIKAAAGGGGRGMKIVLDESQIALALSTAQNEAKAAFADDSVYIEKYMSTPRHIELQIAADSHGNVVHFGERDCSLQRRHQKVLEEAPSLILDDTERQRMGDLVCDAVRKLGYLGVGTIEFLYENGEFYFIEMNTRIQVEHPVTEMITGIDLVQEQIRIAAGESLQWQQSDITFSGHAIECRINAEHPKTFIPSPGLVTRFHVPGGPGIRIDSAIYAGYKIPPFYDSLIAKLIVHGSDRNECLLRLDRALREFVVEGVETTIPLFVDLLQQDAIRDGNYNIRWLEQYLKLE